MQTSALHWGETDRSSLFLLSGGITLILILGLALFAGLLFSAAGEGRPEPPNALRIKLFERSTKPSGESPHGFFDTTLNRDYKEKWEAVDGVEPPQARIAIIIDDLGYGGKATDAIFSLGVPLTLSVLPGLDKSIWSAREAHRRGFEVMLHLPMEAVSSPIKLGPYGITCDLNREEIHLKFMEALAWVPNAAGTNNHMGSKATRNERVMSELMQIIKRMDLFFVDSRTTLHSKAYSEAQRNGLPSTRRDIFLDNVNKVEYVKEQLRLLADTALERGSAVGIGHVRLSTARAIQEMIPVFRRERIAIVPVSELLERQVDTAGENPSSIPRPQFADDHTKH